MNEGLASSIVAFIGIFRERMMVFGFWRSWAAKTYSFTPVPIEIR